MNSPPIALRHWPFPHRGPLRAPGRAGSEPQRILSAEAFEQALLLERSRVARAGHRSCLVLFELAEGEDAWRDLQRLPARLGRRLRGVDSLGRVGAKRIGIILPGARPDLARRLAERLHRECLPSWPAPEVRAIRAFLPGELAGHLERAPRGGTGPDPWPGVSVHPAGVFELIARPLPLWKRVFDVAVALLALLLLAPLMLAVALAVKSSSPGPVLYRQLRTGHRLHRFWIYKFRTMRSGADRELEALRGLNEMSGPLFKSDADPRVTPLGRLLRRTSLDELPQFFNVLRGDMTLLGPRALSPTPPAFEPWQLRRFAVTPGLACEWQASNRGDVDFQAWMRSDLGYVAAGPSPRRDLGLLARTFLAVLTCAGGR